MRIGGSPVAVPAVSARFRGGATEEVATLGELVGAAPALLTGDDKPAAWVE
ncbi:hypothetical protein [Streptomyces gilvosporeus]|uniref:hypothetical protein n=1 Tax=Streptomyces gilvosporeus TaxID=553510 RepID=UPI00131D5210|nr:hypothetical protein [Streptomyces gilvosporeus]